MFLRRLQETAPELIDFTLYAHRKGLLLPDTYVIDMEIIRENARKILSVSQEQGVKLYYMLKQLGRNPVLARMLDELGYEGAVAVDFREALTFARNGTRLGHVGNLGQIPEGALDAVLAARPHIVTVFSLEKAKSLQRAAEKAGIVQPIQLRLSDETGPCYPGQSGGFAPRELPELLPELRKLPNLCLSQLSVRPGGTHRLPHRERRAGMAGAGISESGGLHRPGNQSGKRHLLPDHARHCGAGRQPGRTGSRAERNHAPAPPPGTAGTDRLPVPE